MKNIRPRRPQNPFIPALQNTKTMSKAIPAAALLLLALAAVLVLTGGRDAPEQDCASAPPAQTIRPAGTPAVTQAPPETQTPVERYVDASRGTYGERAKVYIPEFDVKGTISYGAIENGKILTETFILRDEDGNEILGYTQVDTKDHGHVELISYPQDGYVLLKIDGADSIKLKYKDWMTMEDAFFFYENRDSPDSEIQQYIIN